MLDTTQKRETPAPLAGDVGADKAVGLGKATSGLCNRLRKNTKRWNVLHAFAVKRWKGERFKAERELHDHTLPSTVSGLEKLGVTIDRVLVTVPGWRGNPTQCARYWINEASIPRALSLLGLESGVRA